MLTPGRPRNSKNKSRNSFAGHPVVIVAVVFDVVIVFIFVVVDPRNLHIYMALIDLMRPWTSMNA